MTDQEVKQVYNSARWQRGRDRILIRGRNECQDWVFVPDGSRKRRKIIRGRCKDPEGDTGPSYQGTKRKSGACI